MLPAASSALIITPEEAASSSLSRTADESTIGAGTRRQKNTLIHNLLTNKPVVSSSLPAARMRSSSGEVPPFESSRATLVKRGMPLTIIPAADKGLGWQAPSDGRTSLSLENDPRVDLPRLVHLINDSFRRKLDVRHYLDRIQNRIAGLIIAGEYEGGAILTWEMPPGTKDPTRLVPYLDKFAVLSSSQGSSGVADIVFQSMVRTCFPQGVCWRSRKDNPVNKWYFERSDGTWQIPGTNWTMFWTGGGVVEDEQRWRDYVGVCRDVQPSWADGKKPD
jgi:amino-acid N-acetyltransferase